MFSIKLAPGQIYPLPIVITQNPEDSPSIAPSSIEIELDLMDLSSLKTWTVDAGKYTIKNKKWGDVYKITFLDYDKMVHYGMFVTIWS
jgi:hypothetical protein